MEFLICVLLFTFMIGAIIGSFLNVVALRGLTGESIVLPPSKCPKCHNKLKPWHNIPILSYIFLRGKCAFCKEKISIQYPIVEFITAVLFLATVLKFWFTVPAAFIITAICSLVVMSITDIKEQVVCIGHVWFLIILGLIYNVYLTYNGLSINFWDLPIVCSVIGAIAGAGIMELLSASGFLFVGRRAFGLGDTFIAAGIGAMFGWKFMLLAIALSVVVQVILIAPIFIKKLAKNKDYTTILSIFTFFVSAGAFLVANINGLLENFIVLIVASIVLAGIGFWACYCLIRGMKNNENDLMVLPFGPAMAIATIIILFTINIA